MSTTTTSTDTNTTTNLDRIRAVRRESYRALAATQETLDAAYHAADHDLRAAQLYATQMADAAREAQEAVVGRQADLSDAERVARIAARTAEAAWQEAHAAQEAESAAEAARETNWQAVVATRDAMLAAAKAAEAAKTTPPPTLLPDPDPRP